MIVKKSLLALNPSFNFKRQPKAKLGLNLKAFLKIPFQIEQAGKTSFTNCQPQEVLIKKTIVNKNSEKLETF